MKRGTADHPKVHRLAAQLAIPPAYAVGLLYRLFDWCPTYALSGYFGRWTAGDIARGAGWEGDAEVFVQGLIESRWVDEVLSSAIADTARYGPNDDPLGFLNNAPETRRGISPKFAVANSPETRPRRHLVLHDVVSHAEDWWRKRLETAGFTWWDGSPARGARGRPSKKARRDAEMEIHRKSGQRVVQKPAAKEPNTSEEDIAGARAPASPPPSGNAGQNGPGPEPEPTRSPQPTSIAAPEQLRLTWARCAPNLIPANALTPTRTRLALQRLRERPSLAEWEDIFRRMNAAPFLRGQNDWRWRASFDWVLKPDSVLKVLEGTYDVPPVPPESPLIAAARARNAARGIA